MSSQGLKIKRGDIFYAELSPVIGSEQGGLRPCVVIQNDMGNRYSPTVIIAPITSKMAKASLPTHIEIKKDDKNNLDMDSVILLEQIRTIDKKRLREHLGFVDAKLHKKINESLKISLQL